MSGLDVASGAVGIASLGIQVCQGLISYYQTCKDYSSDIQNFYGAVIDLSKTLGLLKASLECDELNQELAERAKTCLGSCEEALIKLNKKLQKLQNYRIPEGLQRMRYPFQAKTLGKLQQRVDNIQERLKLTLQALHLNSAIRIEASMAQLTLQQQFQQTTQMQLQQTIQQHLQQIKQVDELSNDRNEIANTILQKLRTNAYDYENAKKRNNEAVEGTCKWFVGNKIFRDWLSSPDVLSLTSPFLYTTADPGCGKSVLSRHLIDNILPQEGRTVCYSFFKDDFEDQRGSLQAASALLHQLSISNRYILTEDDAVVDMYNTHGDKLFESFTAIWNTFILASSRSRKETVCVLDALDECREADRKRLLKTIGEDLNPLRLKILFTSRPYDEIRRDMLQLHKEDLPLIHLQGDQGVTSKEIEDEIQLVIASRVNRISKSVRLSSAERDLLQRQLVSVPNRNYLWITLVFDGLMGQQYITKKDIMDLSNSLPRGLSEAYEKILSKSRNVVKTKKILHIVLAARRPLTTSEMAVSLAIDGQRSWADVADEIIPQERIDESIRDLCGLFVTIVDGKVYFLHQTAREFLTRGNEDKDIAIGRTDHQTAAIIAHAYSFLVFLLIGFVQAIFNRALPCQDSMWLHSMDPAESDAVLADICISRLQQGYIETEAFPHDHREAIDQDRSMYLYAADFWSNHYHQSTDAFQATAAGRVQSLFTQPCDRVHWIQRYDPRDYPVHGSALFLATAFGLAKVVALCLQLQDPVGSLIDDRSDEGRTALSWAVQKGNERVARLLIDCGASLDFSDGGGRVPLTYAVLGGNEAVARLLIDSGASLDLPDRYGRTPLTYAVWYRNEGVARLLIESGATASVNLPDQDGRTPLSYAVDYSHEGMARLLIDSGASLDLPDRYGRTPLSHAVQNVEEDVAQLLIDRSTTASINLSNQDGRTALSYAAEQGYEGMARRLINAGAAASVNLPNVDGHTPLSYAVKYGYEGMARLLIDGGATASVNLPDRDGRTPLSYAVEYGYESVARLLIDSGATASVNLPDRDGRTPLFHVLEYGYEIMISLLIESNAGIDSTGDVRRPLPCTDGYEGAVELLIENGACIDLPDNKGRTALSLAIGHACRNVFRQLLVDGGARIVVPQNDGRAALLWAAASGNEFVVKLLIDNDVDIDHPDCYGSTALSLAAENGHEGVARILIKNGACIDQIRDLGQIPFSWADMDGFEFTSGDL